MADTKRQKVAKLNFLVLVMDSVDDDVVKVIKGKDQQWIKEREEKGAFNGIINDLSLNDKEGYRRFFRMDVQQFKEIADVVAPFIKKEDTVMRRAISPE